MILALALAAAIAAQGEPQLSYGPFHIEVSSEDVVGFPVTTIVKTTRMTWTSRNGLVTFALSDDGDEIRATAEAGPPDKRCQFRSNPLQFDRPSKALFREASMACLDTLDREPQVATRRDIAVAAKHSQVLSRCFARKRLGNMALPFGDALNMSWVIMVASASGIPPAVRDRQLL